MRRFALISILFMHPAVAKPVVDKDRSILLMAAALVEMAQQDGKIDEREETMLKREFPLKERANPVTVFTLDKSKLLDDIAALKLNDRKSKGFLSFLALVAMADQQLDPAERRMLDKARKKMKSPLNHESVMTHAKNMKILILHRDLKTTLKSIVGAQQAQLKKDMPYIPAAIYPPPAANKSQVWKASDSGGFQKLSWSPPQEVVGSFWVATEEKTFLATGIIDADGDGVYATYVANQAEPKPKKISAQKVK